jgi:hypothetical protein
VVDVSLVDEVPELVDQLADRIRQSVAVEQLPDRFNSEPAVEDHIVVCTLRRDDKRWPRERHSARQRHIGRRRFETACGNGRHR